VPCPCCLGAVRSEGRGDLWCPTCAWLFAAEMLGTERDPLNLERWLRCPTHQRPADQSARE
jgi:hypothetical protein